MRNPVLRGPGAAVRSQRRPSVRRKLKNLPGRDRNRHVGAYVPRVQNHRSVRDLHIPKLENGNPRHLLPRPPMPPVTIPPKAVDLGVSHLKEATSQRVPQVRRRDGQIHPRHRENLTNRQRDQVRRSLTTKDQDRRALRMTRATMNRTNPSNRQVFII